jgi:hypothetical protein
MHLGELPDIPPGTLQTIPKFPVIVIDFPVICTREFTCKSLLKFSDSAWALGETRCDSRNFPVNRAKTAILRDARCSRAVRVIAALFRELGFWRD